MSSIAENLRCIQDDIQKTCDQYGRNPDDVAILAVSKFHPAQAVTEAAALGLKSFGESRIQEAKEKIPQVQIPDLEWHFIGPLQKNKINAALELFDVIQSVDSVIKATEIANRVQKGSKKKVFAQINISKEAQKQGLSLDSAVEEVEKIASLEGLELLGLMGMAADHDNAEKTRPEFAALAQLRSKLRGKFPDLRLSMGMSGDFKQAIAEGSNIVRIGGALFAHE